MEFIINTDLENTLPASIDFNFEELKTELVERLSYYKGLVVTADTIKDGKEERAKLNKVKAAVEDRRKEVKKLCLAPYEAFEAKCKELTGMIDEASGSIDAQVKAFEEAEKSEKRAAIEEAYQEYIKELGDLLPFERIFSDKWLNKSVLLAAAVAEVQAIIDKARNDVKIIRAMKAECEGQMLDAYFKTLDMTAALSEKARYEVMQAHLAKMKEEPAAPEIKTVSGHGELTNGEAELMAGAIDAALCDSPAEETKTIKVVFHDTTAAFRADMKALTDKHNIQYGGIR